MKQELLAAWKIRAHNKTNTAEQYLFMSLMRDIVDEAPAETSLKYLKRTFSPVANKTKLANGRYPFDFLSNQLNTFRYVSYIRAAAFGITKQQVIDNEEKIVAYAKQIYDILLDEKYYEQNSKAQKEVCYVAN
jgi:hypothetical protein